jgi:hypothetical protein
MTMPMDVSRRRISFLSSDMLSISSLQCQRLVVYVSPRFSYC